MAIYAAEPSVKPIGTGLYAYISDNDASANSTFLIGDKGILVVDTGLNAAEGTKLRAIRRLRLAVEVHCEHALSPDHQGGNSVVGPSAVVISTDLTRERTLEFIQVFPCRKALHLNRRT